MSTPISKPCSTKASTLIPISELDFNTVYNPKHREVLTLILEGKTASQLECIASISYAHIGNVLKTYNVKTPNTWTGASPRVPLSIDHVRLGERIERQRQHLGITTRSQLSQISGVSPQKISNIEGGLTDATFSILVKIAGALKISLNDLLAYKLKEDEVSELEHDPLKYTALLPTPTFDALTDESSPAEIAQAKKEIGLRKSRGTKN